MTKEHLPTRMHHRRFRTGFRFRYNVELFYVLVLLFSTFSFGKCEKSVVAANEQNLENTSDNNAEDPIPQVRYRTRPVAAFRSGPKPTNGSSSVTNSSSNGSSSEPSSSRVPFIAVHDLTSQTLGKLQENLEVFIRNLHARRSQEESQRSSSSSGGAPSNGGNRETVRRPPYSNVYTLKYHPVVLEGEGSSSVDDIINGNSRSTPPRTFNGISFNPFPFDPKGEGSKNVDMDKHTVATVYTIGICLTIMAVGSVMFILINKCDGTGGGQYSRTTAGNRIARSVIGVGGRGGAAGVGSNTNGNGRSRNGRSGRSNNESNASSSVHVSGGVESVAKVVTDLPPSYASLFPEGGPKKQDIPDPELASSSNSASATTIPPPPLNCDDVSNNANSSSNSINENLTTTGGTTIANS